MSNSDKEKKDGGESVYGSKESSEEEGRGKEKEEVTARTKLKAPLHSGAFSLCAEHVRQLEGESPFHNLMEVK